LFVCLFCFNKEKRFIWAHRSGGWETQELVATFCDGLVPLQLIIISSKKKAEEQAGIHEGEKVGSRAKGQNSIHQGSPSMTQISLKGPTASL
jgi:hypothetical protein